MIYEKLGVVEGSARGAVEGPSDWPHLAHELQRSNRYTTLKKSGSITEEGGGVCTSHAFAQCVLLNMWRREPTRQSMTWTRMSV